MAKPRTCGRVTLEPIISLNRHHARGHIEDDIPEPAAIVLVSERHKSFEAFLQIRGVVVDRLVLTPRIPFAVETLHFLGGAIVAVSIKVSSDKGHARFREHVAFGKYGGLGALFLWTQGIVLKPCIVLHFYSSASNA